jgi:hypothetical protein
MAKTAEAKKTKSTKNKIEEASTTNGVESVETPNTDETTETKTEKKIEYPEFKVVLYAKGSKNGPITQPLMKRFLGWESEEEFTVRKLKEDPKADKEELKFGEEYTLVDENKQKIRCWNCDRNRPFRESHARSLAQDILNRNWAGPTTMEGETVNGETMIISKTGQVNSAVHRLAAGVLACQMWASDSQKHHWQQLWPTEPVLESLVVFGASDNERVIRTYDNVMPRTLADIFFTSELFSDLSQKGKKECSRILNHAVDLLWKRTRYRGKEARSSYDRYQTHSASLEFVNCHGGQKGKLMEAVKHIYHCDTKEGRVLSKMQLNTGHCAAALYMMGCSTSNGDDYRNMDTPGDKVLRWENWPKAKQFWSDVADKKPSMEPLRIAIGELADEETGVTGRPMEKLCLIAKAWSLYEDNLPLSKDELELEVAYNEKGVRHLVERPDFGGIDLGPGEYKEKKISKEEKELAAKAIRDEKSQEMARVVEEKRKKRPRRRLSSTR